MAAGGRRTADGAGAAGSGSFGGVRAPGGAGAVAWFGREALGWARWFWRQLTSMRVALILLFLLALAAIPGSLVPQDGVDALAAANFRRENGALADVYETLQLFNVYSSVWFSAIYLLLFVSLVGCIVPRSWQFVGQLRGRPPRAPRRLNRMPAYTTWRTDAEPAEVLDAARRLLRRRRFRTDGGGSEGYVAAEKGYLREAGNLVFHLALIVLLVAFAYGQLYTSEGGKLVARGDSFSNSLPQYDDFSSGTLFDVDDLERFGFTLDDFHYDYSREGPNLGTATEFRADVSYWTGDDPDTERQASIEVNDPLEVGDAKVYLLGHGYAPVVTVTDGQGQVAYHGPVPFLPQDNAFTSTGVIKVPDYLDENGEPDQLGFQGLFNPTYAIDAQRGPHSTFPEPDLPVLTLTGYHGDLGIDSGLPQNVYQLDTDNMEQLREENGDIFRFDLLPGESIDLPDGKGTLTFERLDEWATFQVSTKAGNDWALAGALAAVAGLAASLLLQRRRIWVRVRDAGDGSGGAVVEMASLGRSESARIPEELADLAAALRPAAPVAADPDADPDGDPDADVDRDADNDDRDSLPESDPDRDPDPDPDADRDAGESADPASPSDPAQSASAQGART
ncbi:cytochrome c biogenesis protein ResB [Streptomyces sp. B6B3]|uniref:cytochrome c biogenesis protein ResB n=1 Tax=Streptomyces sp. B6B3 TaxID=3153570 RepID=UPI00325C99AB